jgi:hypothetical protein
MPLRALIAALVFAVLCGRAIAADVVGYSEAFDALYRVDLTTRTATEVGHATPQGVPRYSIIVGLTLSPDGRLYAVSDASAIKTLLQIDPGTGLATNLGVMDLSSSGADVSKQLDLGLAFTCDGRMWMSSGSGLFWQVNPASATATFVGNLGVKITGLAARGNELFGFGSQGNNNLYQIDVANAHATLVGDFGPAASYISASGPAFDTSGRLWVILDYVPPPNDQPPVPPWSDLASVNPVSGTLTDLGNITATGNSVNDLEFIGLRGLAIPPSACAFSRPSVVNTPALGWSGISMLVALLVFIAGTRLPRRRPTT